MPDDDEPRDLPDPDALYLRYLETCKRLGVTPSSRERAQALVDEWNRAIRGEPPPTKH